MKQLLKWTTFVLFAPITGLALALLFVAGVQSQSPVAVVERIVAPSTPTQPLADGYFYGYGPGMTLAPAPSAGVGPYGYGHMAGMMGGSGSWGDGGWGNVAPQDAPAPVDEEIQLTATDSRFDPATITVKTGEAVRLVVANQDSVPHNLYSPDVPIAYSLLPAGATRSVSVTAPPATGTYLAVCTFHPGMTLEVVVK